MQYRSALPTEDCEEEMGFVRVLLTTLLLASVLVVLAQSIETCPDGHEEEFRRAVASAACNYTDSDLEDFKNETRWRHGKTERSKIRSPFSSCTLG